MIPTHRCLREYSEYEVAYKSSAKRVMEGAGTEDLQRMCQSLFHYSFHVIPSQQKGKDYTPAAVAFYSSGLISVAVKELLTKLAQLSVMNTVSCELLVSLRDDALLKEVADALGWNFPLVTEAIDTYLGRVA